MSNRPWQIWLSFAICLALVVLALGWLSVQALEVDRAEATARRQAALEENVRLALWRIDSTLVPLIAHESSSPPWAGPPGLALSRDPLVRQHFRVNSEGKWTSITSAKPPEVEQQSPIGDSDPVREEPLLAELERYLSLAEWMAVLPAIADPPDFEKRVGVSYHIFVRPPSSAQSVSEPAASEFENEILVDQTPVGGQVGTLTLKVAESQDARARKEFQARQRFVSENVLKNSASSVLEVIPVEKPLEFLINDQPPLATASPKALWMADQLVLARRVRSGDNNSPETIEGFVFDWPALRQKLLAEVADLLPAADLLPSTDGAEAAEPRLLAALPVRLVPGETTAATFEGLSPTQLALALAWGAMLLAAAAVAMLLHGVIALSERRAAFVSAVTHELRTPLTTFRMYSEMLSEGMISDEQQRRGYLETLRVEADRLTHLVANVLAYARVERGRPAGRIERVAVADLLQVATARLADRATQAGFNLSVEIDPATAPRSVMADPAVVEQILFNVVDNSCKYAASAEDRSLTLSASADSQHVWIRVRDYGPGVASDVRRRLFQPFRKSASEAAHSAPGVGLGLALSRRLARAMGGELRHEPNGDGACFSLGLRIS